MHVKLLAENDFVTQVPGAPIEQSWSWGELQTTIPGRPQFYVWGVFEGDGERPRAMIASMLVIRQAMGLGKTWLWCPRGPVLPLDHDEATAAWRRLKEACDTMAHRHGDVFLRVEPGALPDGVDLGGTASKESYLPAHTLVLDLSLSEDALLQQMAQKGRYNIKIAEREGVTVREGGLEDVPAFYTVLQETGARDGFGVHAEAFYHEFMKCLSPAAHLYLAEKEGVLLGGLLATHWGGRPLITLALLHKLIAPPWLPMPCNGRPFERLKRPAYTGMTFWAWLRKEMRRMFCPA